MASTFKNLPAQGDTVESADPAIVITKDLSGAAYIGLDASKIVVGSASTVTNRFVAGETISALKAVYFDVSTGCIRVSVNDDVVKASSIGITKTSGSINDEIEVLQYGLLSDPFFSFQPSDLIFLGDSGSITVTAPDSGYLTRLGRVINNNTILVLIESPVVL